MNDKRISGLNRGGWRRHGDPPAWLDDNLPIEQRRHLLDLAIRAIGRCPQQAGATPEDPEVMTDALPLRQPKQAE